MSILLPLQERTSKQWSVVSPTRWEISAVTNCKHHRRPKTLQSRWFPPVRPHSSDTLPGPTAGKRILPCAGQVQRWKVEMGFSQRWVAARCSTAQPLLSTPLPWEKLTGEKATHNGCEHLKSGALYILGNPIVRLGSPMLMLISVFVFFFPP